jgi:uncharacterized protein YcbX
MALDKDRVGMVGTVGALWRYPVKSMAGEQLQSVTVGAHGLRGDRSYALVDRADGKVATAKNPRKWPGLLDFAATLMAETGDDDDVRLPPVLVTTPDGTESSSADPDLGETLRQALGREVVLRTVQPGPESDSERQLGAESGSERQPGAESASERSWRPRSEEYWPDIDGLDLRDTVTDFELPAGTFFDSAEVHVLSTATLARLAELHPEGDLDPRRFRPNVVVDTGELTGFVEDGWVGSTLRIGDDVRLEITGPCPRCVMVTLGQADLAKDTAILRAAARDNDLHVGVYATVASGGLIRTGDPVRLT